MPIRPENRHYYKTDEWKAAKAAVMQRANGFCEQCGAPNRTNIVRCIHGDWVTLESLFDGSAKCDDLPPGEDDISVKIVLTVAHLDQNPVNNDLNNLAHLCQKCHNAHDAPYRVENRRRNQGQIMIGDEK